MTKVCRTCHGFGFVWYRELEPILPPPRKVYELPQAKQKLCPDCRLPPREERSL